ncbi:hypothetical protein DICVIV_03150 [Dictyocaulus viviparus]|uniref:Uncharacterized protein n=1 Tax=Dictyocaulus viviparus TaxID=29172 RepID=A0A0D8Y204_DICVI|nr:hypothetical protein DICVIV_03150 [Dictyocaulus viviparus]
MMRVCEMVRGCFCDCFGPISRARSESIDKPLDPEDVRKCLEKYRAYEARQEMMACVSFIRFLLNFPFEILK